MFLCDPQLGESEQQSGGDAQSQSAERPEASPAVSQNLHPSEETSRVHGRQQQAQPARRRQKVSQSVRLCPNTKLQTGSLCNTFS